MSDVRKIVVLSTAHLPEPFFAEPDDREAAYDVTAWYPMTHGALVWVPDDPDDPNNTSNDGDAHPNVILLRRYARGLGCDYILFDNDADREPDLPTWDW
jgi:hypothetical protein